MNVSADSLQVIHFTERQRRNHLNHRVLLPLPVNIVIKGRTSDVMFVVIPVHTTVQRWRFYPTKIHERFANEVFNGLIKS